MSDKPIAEVSPEKELLICCARTKSDPENLCRIQQLSARALDWEYVLDNAAEHAVRPLLFKQLLAANADKVPAVWMERLREAYRANSVRNLVLSSQLLQILGRLEEHGIWAIPYKGPVLATQAYGDVALREFEDLDFIVLQEDLPGAHQIIIGLGFSPRFPWIHRANPRKSLIPGEYSYVDPGRGIAVEFHTEATLRHFPIRLDLREFQRRLVNIPLGPKEVQTFSAEDQILILSVHGAKDFWERLSWAADIAALVCRPNGIHWGSTMEQAQRLGIQRMMHVALALAAELWNIEVPEEIHRTLQLDEKAKILAQQARQRLLAREHRILSAPLRFRWRVGMMTSFPRGLGYGLRLAMAPSEEDFLLARLPRPIRSLASVMRPLRLLRKYGPRASFSDNADR